MVEKTVVAIFSILILSIVLTACNATRGVGEDISDDSNATSGTATKAQQQAVTVRQSCRAVCFFAIVTKVIVEIPLPPGRIPAQPPALQDDL